MATRRIDPSSSVSSTPVSSGRASSVEAARTTWRSPSATMGAGSITAGSSPTATAGNSTAGNARSPKRERAAEISTFSSAPSTVTAPDSSDRTMSTAKPRRHHALAVFEADDLELHPDGQVQIGPGDHQGVPRTPQQQPREHRRGDRAAAGRPAGGREGLDERVAF